MTLRELLGWGRIYLKQQGVGEARQDAWLLLEHVTGLDRSRFFLKQEEELPGRQEMCYRSLIEKRGRHIPLQQLAGEAWFMGLRFFVNEHVLAPRQDTECLVERVLERLNPQMRILDMCTGSGCVLLSLLKEEPLASGVGADLSPEALAVAKRNSEELQIPAEFIESNLFERVEGQYDIIVSNPPYIASGVIPTLMEEVREHEPMMALDGGRDGLDFYRRITLEAPGYLKAGGWLGFEIGYDQSAAVCGLMENAGFTKIRAEKDLAGLDRTVLGQLK